MTKHYEVTETIVDNDQKHVFAKYDTFNRAQALRAMRRFQRPEEVKKTHYYSVNELTWDETEEGWSDRFDELTEAQKETVRITGKLISGGEPEIFLSTDKKWSRLMQVGDIFPSKDGWYKFLGGRRNLSHGLVTYRIQELLNTNDPNSLGGIIFVEEYQLEQMLRGRL